ncbi:universal stress protein [Streptosporangium sp. CA-135522]|uniref:universal stress protein n=1 Tax=Streptosporangium sp. CA-135522 TaxID=3240072 RepID=UPI003D8DB0BA
MNRPVITGTDGSSAASEAVRWAAREAVLRARPLKIVHVREQWAGDIPVHTMKNYRDPEAKHCRAMLADEAEAARASAPGLEVTTALVDGDLVQRLLEESRTADQVVIGSRGQGGFSGLLLGSVGMGVAGRAGCPVVVVRGDSTTRHGRIVVGVDGSEGAEAALAHAFEEAEIRGAVVHAVHAWQPPVLFTPAVEGGAMTERAIDERGEFFRRVLTPWRERFPGVTVTESVVCGHPVGALCDASTEADMVVVGSRGHGLLASAVFGSVSHGVLHHSHCPVAVVRPGGQAPEPA